MRNTRIYTFGFALLICLICAAALGGAVDLLRDKQEKNALVDRWRNVLKAVGLPESGDITKLTGTAVEAEYKSRIKEGYVFGSTFLTTTEAQAAGKLDKKGQAQGGYELYQRVSKDGSSVESYCIPVSGKGLWSTLYGFIALKPDMNTVAGLTFYAHKETPGLGGEIEKDWFTDNFKGKKILDETNKLASVKVIKGKAEANDPHGVDGISGATFTSIGVTKLLKKDLGNYMDYINAILKAQASENENAAEADPEQKDDANTDGGNQ